MVFVKLLANIVHKKGICTPCNFILLNVPRWFSVLLVLMSLSVLFSPYVCLDDFLVSFR